MLFYLDNWQSADPDGQDLSRLVAHGGDAAARPRGGAC